MVCTRRKISESVPASSGVRSSLHQRDIEFGKALRRLREEVGEQVVHAVVPNRLKVRAGEPGQVAILPQRLRRNGK